MRARLFARFGPEEGLEVEFGGEATIGRGGENSVPLRSREVSQQHARVYFDTASSAYWLEDLDSLNGTLLDGEPVREPRRLGDLHVLGFGGAAELFFLALDREPEAEPAPAAGGGTRVDLEAPELPAGLRANGGGERTRVDAETPILPAGLGGRPGATTRVEEAPAELPSSLTAGAPAPPAASAPGRFVLEVPGEGGGRFELREGENLVGRARRARVALRNRELSRRHATLRVEGGRVWLRDEGSRNKTYVGGEQLREEVELEPGSELRFGRIEARLRRAEEADGEGSG